MSWVSSSLHMMKHKYQVGVSTVSGNVVDCCIIYTPMYMIAVGACLNVCRLRYRWPVHVMVSAVASSACQVALQPLSNQTGVIINSMGLAHAVPLKPSSKALPCNILANLRINTTQVREQHIPSWSILELSGMDVTMKCVHSMLVASGCNCDLHSSKSRVGAVRNVSTVKMQWMQLCINIPPKIGVCNKSM
jgi:hypothetical protein